MPISASASKTCGWTALPGLEPAERASCRPAASRRNSCSATVGGERAATAVAWTNQNLHVGCEIFHGDSGVLEAKHVIEDLAAKYQLVELSFDPWRFGQAAQELAQRGVATVAFPQSDSRMIPASDRLYRAIVEARLTLPDHEVLRQHAANAIARHSRRGWRIDSPGRNVNVDAIVALAMALEAVETQAAPAELVGWL